MTPQTRSRHSRTLFTSLAKPYTRNRTSRTGWVNQLGREVSSRGVFAAPSWPRPKEAIRFNRRGQPIDSQGRFVSYKAAFARTLGARRRKAAVPRRAPYM
jgi:hypothetical protein